MLNHVWGRTWKTQLGKEGWVWSSLTFSSRAPIIWPPDVKSWLIRKDPDAGKGWRQEDKGMTKGWLEGITGSMGMSLSRLWEIVKDREAWHAAAHGVTELDMTEWLSNKYRLRMKETMNGKKSQEGHESKTWRTEKGRIEVGFGSEVWRPYMQGFCSITECACLKSSGARQMIT